MAQYIDFSKEPPQVRAAAIAIGLDHKRPYMRGTKTYYRTYRNYYTSFPASPESVVWMDLVNKGYATYRMNRSGTFRFELTRMGLDWLGDELGVIIQNKEANHDERTA